MQQKNQDIYYELLLKHYKDSLKNFSNTNVLNNKLEIVNSLFNKKMLICLKTFDNEISKEDYDKIFYYSLEDFKNTDNDKYCMINFNENVNSNNVKIIFFT